MARILRGEIYWANLDPTKGKEQSGKRPVIVISEDVFNERSGTVIAVAITSQQPKAGFPLTVELVDTSMPKKSWVKVSQLRTLAVGRLSNRLAVINEKELDQVLEGLKEIIGA
jgi:mRNA interferase MazF